VKEAYVTLEKKKTTRYET